MKHKHAEVIKAFVDGIECERFDVNNKEWYLIRYLKELDWSDIVRIKPIPVIREEYLLLYNGGKYATYREEQSTCTEQIKLIYKDDVLVDAKVIK